MFVRPSETQPARVGWIFSLIRSGSSIAAYATAAGAGLEPGVVPVADEVFGPWVRTGKLYQFPAEQKQLVEAFKAAGHRLTPEVVDIARRLFDLFAERSAAAAQAGESDGSRRGAGVRGRVVSKCPHLMFTPEEFASAFPPPDHRAIYLIRNPIHRLNSQYLKGWDWMIEKDHDVRVYTEFTKRWLAHREAGGVSVTFDDLKNPATSRQWFRDVYRGLGWDVGEVGLDRAEAYRAGQYHSSSKELAPTKDPDLVDSERQWRVPDEAIRAYLDDPFLRGFMHDRGWPTRASAYRDGWLKRALSRMRTSPTPPASKAISPRVQSATPSSKPSA